MDALATEGFVVQGGPLGGTERFLFVVDAEDEPTLRSRLAADPWTPMEMLVIESSGNGPSFSTTRRWRSTRRRQMQEVSWPPSQIVSSVETGLG
jgi:hypothetical protein